MRLTILLLCSLLTSAFGAEVHRITIAQLKVTRDVDANLAAMKRAFAQAGREKAEWIVFPEAMLSGYYGGFDQQKVAPAFKECQSLCRQHKLTGLIGTCWRENGKVYNQIRIVSSSGELVNAYAKRCLTYGDARWAEPGTTDLVFQAGGLKFGTLICNDLWVTPGFTERVLQRNREFSWTGIQIQPLFPGALPRLISRRIRSMWRRWSASTDHAARSF